MAGLCIRFELMPGCILPPMDESRVAKMFPLEYLEWRGFAPRPSPADEAAIDRSFGPSPIEAAWPSMIEADQKDQSLRQFHMRYLGDPWDVGKTK